MSKDAKETINAIKSGNLPPINNNSDNSTSGLETNQRGIDRTNFGLQTITEGQKINRKKKI